jgi:16S rRNA (adenine1518-N6/adenine1519-N6)-dimethyltransferase
MKIDELPQIKEVLQKSNLLAKKSLSQNFLFDLNLTVKIANLNGSLVNSTVLEIGPGPGALTRALLASGVEKVIAIEKDKNFIPILKEIEKVYPNRLEIIEQDALTFDIENLNHISNLKIISNLPYNIGTKLLINWLQPKTWPPIWRDMTLMFQKEVANRIVATHGTKTYGRLSILAQWRSSVKISMNLPPEAFRPIPKVHSSVVSIFANDRPKFAANPLILERIVKSGFNQRRKMLRSSLKKDNLNIEKILKSSGIKSTLRAENLSISDWCNLARIIENYEKG